MGKTKLGRTQECPLCGAVQPLSLRRCTICGAKLAGEPTPVVPMVPVEAQPPGARRPRYDPAEGDDDLFISDLSGRMWRLIAVAAVVLVVVLAVIVLALISRLGDDEKDSPQAQVEQMLNPPSAEPSRVYPPTKDAPGLVTSTPIDGDDTLRFFTYTPVGGADEGLPTVPPTATPRGEWPFSTNTARPTLAMATITPMPTETPTPGPCYQTAQAGDTVFGMAVRCGHKDMAIVDEILEINGMKSAVELQINQTLEIPWPTPTPGGESPPVSDAAGAGDSTVEMMSDGGELEPAEAAQNEFGTPDVLEEYRNVEPTLRPGLAWHSVQPGETILSIMVDYDASLETLSQINPEVPFLQCDFGLATGGENCSVMLYEGQRVRVPVPLPTQTLTPTPSGTLTPTPTATATFNAPFLLGPVDGAHFYSDQRVTLRWGGTGTLGPDERYLVRVHDRDTNEDYMALVQDTMYILPGGWQPDDRKRHTLEWTVSIAVVNTNFDVLSEKHLTEMRIFTWDSW